MQKDSKRPRIFPRGVTLALVLGVAALLALLIWIGLRNINSPAFYVMLGAMVLLPPLVFSFAARRALPSMQQLDRDSEAEKEQDDETPYPPVPEYLKDKPKEARK